MRSLFTAKGQLLIRIVERPGVTVRELAEDRFLTRRSVWGMIGELRKAGYLMVRKDGTVHHYNISAFGLTELRKLTEAADDSTD